MKKLLLVLIAVIGISFAASAQNAIGVSLGGGEGYGAELSYQKGIGGMNRLEFDLGYRSWSDVNWFALSAIYQAHFDINAVPNLGWYVGAGARVDLYTYSGTSIALGVVGQAGIDYHFDALPLQLSLDIRPCFYVYPETSFQWGDVALGIRYMF